jgi:hypothetical protein
LAHACRKTIDDGFTARAVRQHICNRFSTPRLAMAERVPPAVASFKMTVAAGIARRSATKNNPQECKICSERSWR